MVLLEGRENQKEMDKKRRINPVKKQILLKRSLLIQKPTRGGGFVYHAALVFLTETEKMFLYFRNVITLN